MRKLSVCLFIFVFLLTWELLTRHQPSLYFVLPPPSKILSTLFAMKERFFFHTMMTLKEILLGFILACSAAFPLAWIMFRFKSTSLLLQPLFVLIQCIPMFTLAPLMVIWFGWGLTAIVVPTALMIFFPLTLNFYQGLRSTPQPLIEFFQLNGATQWQMFFKLRLPAALPHLFSGLRLSAAIAGIGAVAGEWAGAQHGLGILMLESRRNSDLEITFAALLCLSLVTLTFYGSTLLAEHLCRSKHKLHSHILLSLLLLTFTFGCSKPKTTTLLLDWLPNPNHVPLYVGLEKGFFKEEGIDLSIQKMFDNGGGMSYLTSKKADLILAHLPGALKASSLGAHIHLVAVLIPQPLRGLIFKQNQKIHNPENLSNLRLGYCIGGPDTTFLDYLLQQGKITPSSRKNVSADLIAALGTDAVDFIYGGFWNIEPYQLAALGIPTSYFPIEDLNVPKYPEIIVLCNSNSQQSTPLFAQAFRKALDKSILFCHEHPQEAFDLYLQQNPDKSSLTKSWEQQAWQRTLPLLPVTQTVNRKEIQLFYEWQIEQRILLQEVNINYLLSLYPED